MLSHERSGIAGLSAFSQNGGEPHHDARNPLRCQLSSERDDIAGLALQWKGDGRVVSVVGRTFHLTKSQVDLDEVGSRGFDFVHDLIERWNRISAAQVHRIQIPALRTRDRQLDIGKSIDLEWALLRGLKEILALSSGEPRQDKVQGEEPDAVIHMIESVGKGRISSKYTARLGSTRPVPLRIRICCAIRDAVRVQVTRVAVSARGGCFISIARVYRSERHENARKSQLVRWVMGRFGQFERTRRTWREDRIRF